MAFRIDTNPDVDEPLYNIDIVKLNRLFGPTGPYDLIDSTYVRERDSQRVCCTVSWFIDKFYPFLDPNKEMSNVKVLDAIQSIMAPRRIQAHRFRDGTVRPVPRPVPVVQVHEARRISRSNSGNLQRSALTVIPEVPEPSRSPVEECCVCLDHKTLIVLRCDHKLCNDCFRKITSRTCPLCRGEL